MLIQAQPGKHRLRDRTIPFLLRLGTAASESLVDGKGVGFMCTMAAGFVGVQSRLSFQLRGGGTFTVQTDDRYWLRCLLVERNYETDIDHFLSRALTPSDSFLDCGANLGLWSIAAARVIADARRVVAVEAGSRTFEQLELNWAANDRSFTLLHRALSQNSGEQVCFFSSTDHHASSTLIEGLSPRDAREELVTSISLEDLLIEQSSYQSRADALTFVKLDVEGLERQILSTILPDRHGNVVFLYEDHGSDTEHVTKVVLEQGFRVAFLADDGSIEPIRPGGVSRLDKLKTDPGHGYNLLAFAPSGQAALRMSTLFGLHDD